MKRKKHPYLNLLSIIWEFSRGRHARLIFTYTLSVCANIVLLFQPYLLGKFLNVFQEGGPDALKQSAFFLGSYALLSFFFWMLHGPSRTMERILAFEIFQNFSDKMFTIITRLPMQWHKDHHSGNTIDRVNKAGHSLKSFMEDAFLYVEAIIPFFGSLFAMGLIAKTDAAYIFIFSMLALLMIFRFDDFLVRSLREINRREHKVSAVFFDYVSNISTVITLRLERLARNEFLRRLRYILPVFRRNVVVNEVKWFTVDMILAIGMFTTMIVFVWKSLASEGTVLVGTLMMLYGYLDKYIHVFYGLAWKYEKLVMTSTDVSAVNPITDAFDEMGRRRRMAMPTTSGRGRWKHIEIRNLHFKYEDKEHHVHTLKDIALDLRRGEKVALVGESGGGKSTLLSVLRGLNQVQKVSVKIDGKTSGLAALSGITTLIPQDPEIFENTIEYNITMGIRHKRNEVERAVKLARFDAVVKRLPQGLQTDIRERGVNLSGGEKQRLALARGIFAALESDIILLDEPTSSVDSANERAIYENLMRVFAGKCLVSTVHRLHLLHMFDAVYVISRGEVVEYGTAEALLRRGGVLKGLWDKYEARD